MEKLKAIGYVNADVQENSIKIIIDERFTEKLSKLLKYNYVIIASDEVTNLTKQERQLREMFGFASEIHKVKLISIADNVVEVEKFGSESKLPEVAIFDIKPYYPEYDDMPLDSEGNPDWLRALGNDNDNQQFLH